MLVSNADVLGGEKYDDGPFTWGYIILDESHKIKTPNKTSKCIRSIPANYGYICTGTAVQNNLMEIWSLFDYTHQGELLGTRKTFEIECAKPNVRAREKDAKKLPNFHFLEGFWSTKSVKAYLSICFMIMDLLVIKEIKISYIFFSPLFSHSSILPKSP